jgi:hypothetical protein
MDPVLAPDPDPFLFSFERSEVMLAKSDFNTKFKQKI